jgi:hypothetical protein
VARVYAAYGARARRPSWREAEAELEGCSKHQRGASWVGVEAWECDESARTSGNVRARAGGAADFCRDVGKKAKKKRRVVTSPDCGNHVSRRLRLFAWLRHFRRLVIRWEYQVENFFGMVRLGCMQILLRHL